MATLLLWASIALSGLVVGAVIGTMIRVPSALIDSLLTYTAEILAAAIGFPS
jgi:hypothetical protein